MSRLRDGVDPRPVVQALEQLEAKLLASLDTSSPQDQLGGTYLAWVDEVEAAQRGWWDDDDYVSKLHTPRYALLRAQSPRNPGYETALRSEAELQLQRLRRDTQGLLSAARRWDAEAELEPALRAAPRVVIDTNVYMHFPWVEGLDLLAQAGADAVRVVVPMVVLTELDNKKNGSNATLSRRAGAALKRLEEVLSTASPPDAPVMLGPALSMQLVPDPDQHTARSNNDEEILDRAAALAACPGGPVLVCTGDMSMRTRARSRGLRAISPAEELRLPVLDADARELAQHRAAASRGPKLTINFVRGLTYVDPPPFRVAPDIVGPGLLAARADHPLMTVLTGSVAEAWDMGAWRPGLSNLDARRYNAELTEWLAELEDWLREEQRRARQLATAVELPLVLTNRGDASATDVEVLIELPAEAGLFFTGPEGPETGPQPQPPDRPGDALAAATKQLRAVRLAASSTRLEPASFGWNIHDNGRAASQVLPTVRHDGRGRPVPLGDSLLVTSYDGEPLTAGLSLTWQASGSSPTLLEQGALQIRPSTVGSKSRSAE